MLFHIIADYGFGDLAFAEVVQRIKFYLPDAEPILTPVPAFATIAAGFCIAQLGLNDSPAGTIIYHNVAPREDDEQARAGNAGERLAFARLATGVRVIGVNAGHAFSFVRDAAEDLRSRCGCCGRLAVSVSRSVSPSGSCYCARSTRCTS